MIKHRLFSLGITIFLWACFLHCVPLMAEEYLSQAALIERCFKSTPPDTKLYWLTEADKKVADSILGHPFKRARLRYWQEGTKTLWILDEIGKVKPITLGITLDQHKITKVDIMAFRESRGWEIKNPAFTEQFLNQKLTPNYQLTQSVDGIAGATLSVRAVTRLARLALYLAAQTTPSSPQ